VTGDKAAGDLVEEFNGVQLTFAQYVIEWLDYININKNSPPVDTMVSGVTPTRHDALSLFYELNYQAASGTVVATNAPTYAELSVADQTAILTAIDSLLLPPATMPGGTAPMLQTLFRLILSIVNTAYGLNFPEHRVSLDSPIGVGAPLGAGVSPPGRPKFSDAANEISSPNVAGTGTWFDFSGTYFPIKKPVEDRIVLGLLEAVAQPAASEAELATLLADDASRTL
jgi:hypothetical protein